MCAKYGQQNAVYMFVESDVFIFVDNRSQDERKRNASDDSKLFDNAIAKE